MELRDLRSRVSSCHASAVVTRAFDAAERSSRSRSEWNLGSYANHAVQRVRVNPLP